MMDSAVFRLSVFFGLAIVGWLASLKFGLRDYQKQPLSKLDFFLTIVGIGMAATYEFTVLPGIYMFLFAIDRVVGPVRDYFYHSHPLVQLAVYGVISDLGAYWMHRFLHSSAMWRFHAFHHSPKSLNWLSGMRGNPVHYIAVLLPYTFAAGMTLFTRQPELMFVILLVETGVQHLTHTALRLPMSKQIEYLFITPRLHFVHHHPNPRYTDTNYGFVFSLWDRMFGTLMDPDMIVENEKGLLGLDYDMPNWKMFVGFRRPPGATRFQAAPGEPAHEPTKQAG